MAKQILYPMTHDDFANLRIREDIPTVEQFLKGKSPLPSAYGPLIRAGYHAIYRAQKNSLVELTPSRSGGEPVCFVTIKGRRVLLMDGDDANTMEGCPTISYLCLAQLMLTPTGKQVIKRENAFNALCNGTIKVVDFTLDEERTKRPREKGFTEFTDEDENKTRWHRSSTVLLRHKNESWLIGQDEGTYFGVVLPDHPKTISAAFASLMPKELRSKKGVQRQGEWFIVPVPYKNVPVVEFISPNNAVVHLPLTEVDGNVHIISCDEVRICGRDCEQGFMPGQIFAENGRLSHDQHEEVRFTGWVTFVRNTALRSVSQEGVD